MSKEVSIFRDETSIVAAAPQGVDEITRRLLGGSSMNLKRISIKNSKWNIMLRGEKIASSANPTLDVVVVNAAEHVSRYWYKQGYDGKSVGAPDCWSNDGVKPDPKSRVPQNRTCEGCPMNIAGSGTNGKGRACRYARRLAVALAGDLEGDVYQIQLPPTSMFGKAVDENHMGLDAYVRHLAGYNYSITGVVTEMRFDPNSDSPRLYFRGVRRLNNEEREVVLEKGQSPEALAAIAFTPGAVDTNAVAAPVEAKATPFRDEEPEVEAAPQPVQAAPKAKPRPEFIPATEPAEEEEPAVPAQVKSAPGGFVVESEDTETPQEPVVRRTAPKKAAPAAKVDMAKLVDEWDIDDE